MGLKDIIVFSTKARSSLASKLSGGDYDGDGAWVYWDTAIVDNFFNVAVPECPDLVKEGYVDKISMTYKELVQGHEDPTSIFLRRSFDSIFEVACLVYARTSRRSSATSKTSIRTVFPCTLLSTLVDQAKTGHRRSLGKGT